MRESFPTIAQPAFILAGITYLPIYGRPTSKRCWIDPAKNLYTTLELIDAGAQMVMMELWERIWLTEIARQKPSASLGEIKIFYQKHFGML